MYSVLLLTPINNVKNKQVIDKNKVFTETYTWDDQIEVGTEQLTELTCKPISEISIFNDLPHINNEFHIIIHMFSSSNITV